MLAKEKYIDSKSIKEFLIASKHACPGRCIYATYVNQGGLNIAL